MSEFNYKIKKYPNGSDYYELLVGKHVIGSAIRIGLGYLALGRKNPVDSLNEAAKQCLDSKMNACMKEHVRLHKLLNRVLAS